MSELKHVARFLVIISVAVISACQAAVKPVMPVIDLQASENDRISNYNQYQINGIGHVFWGYYFTQGTNASRFNAVQVCDIITNMSPVYTISQIKIEIKESIKWRNQSRPC
jgi:hypothetical protein